MPNAHPLSPTALAVLIVTLSCVPAASADPGEVARLEWLSGHWGGTSNGTISEEHWTTPHGGGMVGMHKDARGERMSAFEFLRIVSIGDSTCYLASPNGATPTTFCLVELGERRVVFANPAHDFPRRVLYWLDDAGRLHARIEGENEGRARSKEWVWERLGPGAR